ncbi:hypothetical protein JQ596_15070 [Bradyrhizobium manausense]|uniref:hypothetical protein n=1 Tax=Bradyrhizobium TaxID=374 RepID=UPI001BA76ED5|nr:hypothetical protein [Bradyrhizobium arachidis]MBR0826869.1 hypothetical protein [Bradyrhizobium manausense]UVO32152.1 hypothetical protein KUF59_16730 [Bradyrhizobium arachidis]
MKRLSDEPFAMEWTFNELNEVRFGRVCGASRSTSVMPQHISSTTPDMLALGFNLGASASWFSQRGELTRASGQPHLYSLTEAYRSAGATDALSVAMPRRALQALVPDPESLLSAPLDGSLPAMRQLRRYLCMMNEPGSISVSSITSKPRFWISPRSRLGRNATSRSLQACVACAPPGMPRSSA